MVSRNQWITIALATATLIWYISTTQASIDYWILAPQYQIYVGQGSFQGNQSITIYCKNGGDADGSFDLIITFTNATFSTQTSNPYSADKSSVSVPFLLHKTDANQKVIFYTINKDVSGFSIELTATGATLVKLSPAYPNKITYKLKNNGFGQANYYQWVNK